jgi:hypothetical protein
MAASITHGRVLFVVGSAGNPADRASEERARVDDALRERLTALGYRVVQKDCREVSARSVTPRISLILISPSAPERAGREFRELGVPVVAMRGPVYRELGMTGTSAVNDYGEESNEREGSSEPTGVLILNSNHPMAADLSGSMRLTESPETHLTYEWAVPGRGGQRVATLTTNINKAVVFCYDGGDTMAGLNAPARRVGIFFDPAFVSEQRSLYWRLFDAAVEWAVGERPRQFADVFRAEWGEISTRRRKVFGAAAFTKASPPTRPPANLSGLALSGGGIRAATFSLGLLQGMQRLGLLRIFDYVSTVSGGGYLGGWWSAWLSRDPEGQRGGDDVFPPPELIRPEGEGAGARDEQLVSSEVADEVLSAGRDPVHHLRLFANYLTPRKGVLSPDTWRAATVILRDIVLTWFVLLPVLISAVLLAKLYFVLQPTSYDPASAHAFFFGGGLAPPEALRARLLLTVWPLVVIVGWLAVAVSAWMVTGGGEESRRMWMAGKLGGTIVAVLVFLGVYLYLVGPGESGVSVPRWVWVFIVAGAVGWVIYFFYPLARSWFSENRGGEPKAVRQWRAEVHRYRIARVQAKLVVLFAVAAFFLVLAGFGHELFNYVLRPESGLVAKAGGWLAVLAAVAGSIYTALKNSPSGGSDERLLDENDSFLNRVVFRLTPTLVILVLAVVVSWATNLMLSYIHKVYLNDISRAPSGRLAPAVGQLFDLKFIYERVSLHENGTNLILLLTMTVSLGVLLSFYLVLVETRWKNSWPRHLLSALLILFGLYLVRTLVAMLAAAELPPECYDLPYVPLLSGGCEVPPDQGPAGAGGWKCFADLYACLSLRVLGAIMLVSYFTGWWLIFRLRAGERRRPRRLVSSVLIILIGVTLTYLTVRGLEMVYRSGGLRVLLWVVVFIGGGFVFCLLYSVLETLFGAGDNKRSMWLLSTVYLMLNALLGISALVEFTDISITKNLTEETFSRYVTVLLGQGAFGLFGSALTWVVAMGWMADPNRLSMHNFYRSRLVRAYLGASNKYRSQKLKTIREAVEGDDVLLQDLRNCQRGAPYHLINTTLNLVGGRDLTSAQRSADAFVFSKRYCGSARTGYRDTREYMAGQLSLGTATAVSGAAASPNMGAKTLTSSLAMLMTFLNVRLGFWAPTPNKKDWRESKARLWPFYMLREFTSQTNDLSTYCYLTDGGHFDNTGLYALVERGCRFIVVADCGADPKPCFQDVGDALRRCRIDFGAEIDLDLTPFIRHKEEDTAQAHFSVGTIVYSREHAESLNWSLLPKETLFFDGNRRRDIKTRTGVIVLFKPAVTNRDETADVRQYKLENKIFPQQTTVDQWFDEAQFESYRRLGELCSHVFFYEGLDAGRRLALTRGAGLTLDEIERLFIEASLSFDRRSPFHEWLRGPGRHRRY